MKTIKSEHPYHLLTFRGKRQDIIDFLNGGLIQVCKNEWTYFNDPKLIEPEMSTLLMEVVLNATDYRDIRLHTNNPILCFDAFVPYSEIEKLGLPHALDDEDYYLDSGYCFWAWKVEEYGDELEAKAVNFATKKLDRFVSYLNDKHPHIHVNVEEKGGGGKEVELASKNVKLSQLNQLIREFNVQKEKAKPMILLFDSDWMRNHVEVDELLASVRDDDWSEHYGLALGEKTDPAYDHSIYFIDAEDNADYETCLLDTWHLSEITTNQRCFGGKLFFCTEEDFFEEAVAHIDFIHDYYDVYRVVADTHAEWVEWAKRIDFVPEIIEVVAKHPEWYNSSEEDEDEANEQVLCRELEMLDMYYSLRENLEDYIYRTDVLIKDSIRQLSFTLFNEEFAQAVKEAFSHYKEPEELEIIYEDISFCSIDVIRAILRDMPIQLLHLPLKDRTEKTKLYLQDDFELERIYLSFTPNAEEGDLTIQMDCYTVDEDDDDWMNRGHVGELCIEWTVEDREGNEKDGRSYIASEDMIASAVETFDNIVKNSAK
jgi:hypothetical protein